jgi:hypothetical protein
MKAIYINRNYELSIQNVETTAGKTLVFTTLEELEQIKTRERVLMSRQDQYTKLLKTIMELSTKKKLNKTVTAALREHLG